MRKNLLPLIAALSVCAAATAGVIAARAQPGEARHKPQMVALNTAAPLAMETAGPTPEGGHLMGPPMPPPDDQDHMMMRPGLDGMGRGPERRAEMCRDGYARATAAMAYVETRLQLTQAQRPLFERWKDVKLDSARRRSADCGARPAAARVARPGPVEGMARQEEMLKARLTELSAERPVMEALYKSLTPAQQRDFTPPRPHMMFTRMLEGRGGMQGHRPGPPGEGPTAQ